MPTASSRAGIPSIVLVGAAFPEPPFSCGVHSVYPSAVNLILDIPAPRLSRCGGPLPPLFTLLRDPAFFQPAAALTVFSADGEEAAGEGAGPEADPCGDLVAFDALGLERGMAARAEGGLLRFANGVAFRLGRVPRRAEAPELPALPSEGAGQDALGKALAACGGELESLQAGCGTALRWGALKGEAAQDPMARDAFSMRTLAGAAALEAALSRTGRAAERAAAVEAALGLVGLGPGLTPSGDDFLCGYALAAWMRSGLPAGTAGALDPALVGSWLAALSKAAAGPPARSSDVSLSFLALAAGKLFSDAFLSFAAALAAGGAGWREALAVLGRLGHSSGYDAATGVLYGLAAMNSSGSGV